MRNKKRCKPGQVWECVDRTGYHDSMVRILRCTPDDLGDIRVQQVDRSDWSPAGKWRDQYGPHDMSPSELCYQYTAGEIAELWENIRAASGE